jgi:hypothetical protein
VALLFASEYERYDSTHCFGAVELGLDAERRAWGAGPQRPSQAEHRNADEVAATGEGTAMTPADPRPG